MTELSWQAGIVGCGKIAGLWDQPRAAGLVTTHAQAYHRNAAFRLAAAVSPIPEEGRRFQQAWGVPQVYRSLSEMLNQATLDVISICSPDEFHFSQAREILESPRRPRVLFIEKPVCLSPEEISQLAHLSRQAGVAVLVNHSRRFDPAHRQAAGLVRSGAWGELLQGRGVYYGGWLHNGVHLVDTLRMLLQPEPTVVSARVSRAGKTNDPNLELTLKVAEAAVVLESFPEDYYQLFELELRFESGRVRCLDFGCQIHLEEVQVNNLGERELKPLPQSPLAGLISPLREAVVAIAAYLEGRDRFTELGVDLATVAGTMDLIWQGQELARRGGLSVSAGL